MNRVRLIAIALMLPLLSLVAQTQSGKVSGTLTVNGKKLQIRHVSAVTYDTPNMGRVVSVLLSDNPVDPAVHHVHVHMKSGGSEEVSGIHPYRPRRALRAWPGHRRVGDTAR